MEINSERLIKDFYEKVKDKFPDIPYKDFRNICRSPFLFIRMCMALPNRPIIKVKYLGKFKVSSGVFLRLLKLNEKNYYFKKIPEWKYKDRVKKYTEWYYYFKERNDRLRKTNISFKQVADLDNGNMKASDSYKQMKKQKEEETNIDFEFTDDED